ncbi:MAG: hypothetical protein NZZ41_07075 [Candidatus Dojkabacteria bacterium]|nr:hypothetical protein [Candidatus Dojkabacteria bacterium]
MLYPKLKSFSLLELVISISIIATLVILGVSAFRYYREVSIFNNFLYTTVNLLKDTRLKSIVAFRMSLNQNKPDVYFVQFDNQRKLLKQLVYFSTSTQVEEIITMNYFPQLDINVQCNNNTYTYLGFRYKTAEVVLSQTNLSESTIVPLHNLICYIYLSNNFIGQNKIIEVSKQNIRLI